MNEKAADFPEEIRHIATSLAMETDTEYRRAELAAEVIKELDLMCKAWPMEKQQYLDAYKKDHITIGKEISIIRNQQEKQGTAISLNDNFSLNVCYEDGTKETISGGEVSIRGLYNQ